MKKCILWKNILRSIPFWWSVICVGCSNAVTGPTIILLRENVGRGGNIIGLVFVFRAVGYCIGSIFSGLLFDFFKLAQQKHLKNEEEIVQKPSIIKKILENILYKFGFGIHLWLIVFLIVLTLSIVLQPFIHNVYLLFVAYIFLGISKGVVELGSNLGLVYLWGLDINVPNQIFRFCYGVGAVVFPIVISMFLRYDHHDPLVWCYAVCGISICLPISMLVAIPSPMPDDSHTPSPLKIQNDSKTQSNEPSRYHNLLSNLYYGILVAIFDLFYVGAEGCMGNLIFSFVVGKGLDSDANASILNSLFYGTLTAGRFCAIFLNSIFPKILQEILLFNLSCCLLCSIILCMFRDNLWIIRIFATAMGWFMSLLYPTNYALPKVVFGFEITGIGTCLTLIGGAGGFALSSLVEYLMNHVDLNMLFYFEAGLFVCCLIFFTFEILAGRLFLRFFNRTNVKQ